MKNYTKINNLLLVLLLLFQSCVSKKEILYLQDISNNPVREVISNSNILQPNDIIKIEVSTLIPEVALPFNKINVAGLQSASTIELIKLEGYLVTANKTINFPVLGELSVADKSINDLEVDIKNRLETAGYLINPSVTVRLLNAKVTILGEVKRPGTFTFTENNISLLQALGLAGDLTINGNRKDILLIRTIDSIQTTTHLDLTSADWLGSNFYNIKPNDVLVVNPNGAKVKSAAFFGNASSFVAIASLLISTAVLINNINN